MVANGIPAHNGHVPQPPPVDPQAGREDYVKTHGWRTSEPLYLHSLQWQDPDSGIEHMTVIQADSLEALWQEVRQVTALVKSARAQQDAAKAAPPAAASSAPEGWCPKHQVSMTQQHNTKGTWYSHRLADGTWCKGK